MKALGVGLGACGWHDIEVVRAETGAPSLVAHRRAADLAAERGVTLWHADPDPHRHRGRGHRRRPLRARTAPGGSGGTDGEAESLGPAGEDEAVAGAVEHVEVGVGEVSGAPAPNAGGAVGSRPPYQSSTGQAMSARSTSGGRSAARCRGRAPSSPRRPSRPRRPPWRPRAPGTRVELGPSHRVGRLAGRAPAASVVIARQRGEHRRQHLGGPCGPSSAPSSATAAGRRPAPVEQTPGRRRPRTGGGRRPSPTRRDQVRVAGGDGQGVRRAGRPAEHGARGRCRGGGPARPRRRRTWPPSRRVRRAQPPNRAGRRRPAGRRRGGHAVVGMPGPPRVRRAVDVQQRPARPGRPRRRTRGPVRPATQRLGQRHAGRIGRPCRSRASRREGLAAR